MTRGNVLPTEGELPVAVPRTRLGLGLGMFALVVLVFVADLETPNSIADWASYVVLCLGFLWLCGPGRALFFAGLASVLMVVGLFFSPRNLPFEVALLNRCLGLVCLWVSVLASAAYARRSRRLGALADMQAASLLASETTADRLRENELHLLEGLIGLRSVLTSSLDPVLLVDDRGTIRLASDSVETVFGYRPDELVGRSVGSLMPEPHASAHTGYIERYHATGTASVLGKPRMVSGIRKDGTPVPLEISLARVEVPVGRPWFTGTLRDISQRQEAERERAFLLESERSARLEAERATRAKDEFLAMLSHELRTPLNAALGWVQILRRRQRDEATLGEGLEAIERSTRAQAQLIADMLDMSRILSGKLQTESRRVQLADVVRAAVETLAPEAAAKGVELALTGSLPELAVQGDATRLQQVIWNLLSNAVKFTPSTGRVRVALGTDEGSAVLTVSDTGAGIGADFLPFVFDQFRQADSSITRRHGGLGLGLALVKHIVGLHGGTVEARSEGPGRGSTFTVRLPLAESGETAVTTRTWSDPDLSGVRILVVDDDADACRLLRRMLGECSAEVESASSAAGGLERIESFQPDVLVSDLSMPGMDGYQMVAELRRRERHVKHTPALALSALARPEDRRRALESGFDLYLPKPIERNALLAAVAELALAESATPRARKA